MKNEVKEAIACPQGHIDTYIYDSPEHGLVLMCNPCEDGYSISFEEVEFGPKRNMNTGDPENLFLE